MKTPIKYIILVGITTILYLTSQDIITATDKSQLYGGYREKGTDTKCEFGNAIVGESCIPMSSGYYTCNRPKTYMCVDTTNKKNCTDSEGNNCGGYILVCPTATKVWKESAAFSDSKCGKNRKNPVETNASEGGGNE